MDNEAVARLERIGDASGASLMTAAYAISRNVPIGRQLTNTERLLLALLPTRPTHFIDFTSKIDDHCEATHAFSKLSRRLARQWGKPFIYLAFPVRSKSTTRAGFHVHVVTYEFRPQGVLAKHARGVGMEGAWTGQVLSADPWTRLRRIAYRFGQTESVFGSTTHLRHRAPEKFAKCLLRPANKTLKRERPDLLSALDRAEDRTVTDYELVLDAPFL